MAEASATIRLIDDPHRNANLPAVYAAVDADPQVRAVLDHAEVDSFKVWAGFHRGQWLIRLLPAGGDFATKGRVQFVVDPVTAVVSGFTELAAYPVSAGTS